MSQCPLRSGAVALMLVCWGCAREQGSHFWSGDPRADFGAGCMVGFEAAAALGSVDAASCALDPTHLPEFGDHDGELASVCAGIVNYSSPHGCMESAATGFAQCVVGGYLAGYASADDGCPGAARLP